MTGTRVYEQMFLGNEKTAIIYTYIKNGKFVHQYSCAIVLLDIKTEWFHKGTTALEMVKSCWNC